MKINLGPLQNTCIIIAVSIFASLALSPDFVLAENKPMKNSGNRLQYEKSPYLLQHKDNPVDWYPWGDEAFEKAKRENKPIFLSIGYSTCHWCHVMEHESFEDEEIGRLMNETFVSIKVDREERPDIDHIYMTVCQMLTKSGGWPLTIIMTPDKKPFFAGTYFPKEGRFGRMGLMELIPQVKKVWETQREDVVASAEKITDALADAVKGSPGDQDLKSGVLKKAYGQLSGRFDDEHGGFGRAPKFPTPHNLLFLMRYWKRSGDDRALEMVEMTLTQMRRGGIYDHVGFGFHRYSTDENWFLPHFEKMLYDQALLAMAYTEAYLATGKTEYRQTAEEIFTYVLRDMTSPEGGFYSAEDADSEGEEGKFYLWSTGELEAVLGKKDQALIAQVLNASESGNYSEEATGHGKGTNILHLSKPLSAAASDVGLTEKVLRDKLESARHKLFSVREKRIHPYKDDKVLTDWNGLMIAALARAHQAFGEEKYLEAAEKSMGFVLDKLVDREGRLLHRFREGEAGIKAKVEDYAFTVMALIDLYEASFNTKYLSTAIQMNDDFLTHFWDSERGGFFFTPDYGEKLIVRSKEAYDGALPSGNSVAMLNLLRLERFTGRAELGQRASEVGRAFADIVASSPLGFTQMMSAVDFGVGPSFEVVVVGKPGSEDTDAMLTALRTRYSPNKITLFKPSDDKDHPITRIASFTKTQMALQGKATAYVCRGFECKLPTNDSAEMLKLLESGENE